jgi:AmmeMemoRadiSam system protein A
MDEFELSEPEKKILLAISRDELRQVLGNMGNTLQLPTEIPATLQHCCGLFVSLYNQHQLRACLGRFNFDKPLLKAIREITRSSALFDSRFPEIKMDEFNDIRIEVSVLTPLNRITNIDEIQLGTHGIYLKNGTMSGTYLPQVANKTGWTIEQFLGHCSKEKAGLGWDGWKNKSTEIYTYRAIVFSE